MPVEPYWWPAARELRSKGLSLPTIGRLVGKTHVAVLYAVNPKRRDKQRARRRAATDSRVNLPRERILGKAHREARETGQHIDDVLRAWGEPARRELR